MKNLKLISIVIFVILAFSALPLQTVYADAGPKFYPFTFNFSSDTKNNPILSGSLLTCNNTECRNPTSSNELWCFSTQCVSRFGPPNAPYYKIQIKFSDGIRTSNTFSQVRLSARYYVSFNKDQLEVKEVFHSGFSSESLLILFFTPALIITVLTEKVVAGIFSKKWNVHLKWIGKINLVSLVLAWYVFPTLPIPLIWAWGFAEVSVVIFETLLIAFANKKYNLPIVKFFILSMVANSASILAGVITPIILLFFLWINQECINSTTCNINDYLRWLSDFIFLAKYIS